MTQPTPATAAFRAARDLLLSHREDYDAAIREFAWPELDEFNWALDWFDVVAAEHPGQEALRVVAEDGTTTLTYGELAARSNQVANWLRSLGARRGDRLLLMLGNIAELWEVILAAIKLGVVIIPASTLLSPDDLADRIERGNVRHVVTEKGSGRNSKGSAATGPGSQSSRCAAVVHAGRLGRHLAPIQRVRPHACRVRPGRADQGQRPAAALLHLRYHRAAQAGGAHPGVLSGRPPVHGVLDRPATGRRPPEHLLPRLGEARLEQRVRPVERGGDHADPRLRAVLRGPAAPRVRRAAG